MFRGQGLQLFIRVIATSVALPLFFSTHRADAQADTAPLTLESVSSLAVARSPQVRIAQASLEVARAYRTFSRLPRVGNPFITLRAMVGRPDQSAATYSAAVGLPLDISGRRRAYGREATWVEREAEANLAAAQNDARAEAREAFVDVVLGAELENVAVGNAEIARDFMARVKARFDAKAATALDMALSQRDAAESTAAVARARGALVEARGRLRQALDLDPTAQLNTSNLPELRMPENLTVERAMQLAQAQRREPQALAAAVERGRVADTRLRREAIGPLVVWGEYEAQANVDTRTSGGVGLSTELPVIMRNQAERAQTRAQRELFALDEGLTKRRVAREAMNSYLLLEAALSELATIESEAMPAAEQSLAMTMEMLEVGAIDFFRLLNARQGAFQLRARRVETLRAAWRLRIGLERALGGPPEVP